LVGGCWASLFWGVWYLGCVKRVFIKSSGMVTAAGVGVENNFDALQDGVSSVVYEEGDLCGRLSASGEVALGEIAGEKPFNKADRAVLLGVIAAREAMAADVVEDRDSLAVVMGSSRGATLSIEENYQKFLEDKDMPITASPSTTSGAFAAAVAQGIGAKGQALFVSSACSSGMNAVGMGWSMIQSGMAKSVMTGGAEASLSPFTFKMLRNARVLAVNPSILYPLRPFHKDRTGMVPGEGAACLLLSDVAGDDDIGEILGFGAVTESATLTGVSEKGDGLVKAVHQAFGNAELGPGDVDLIVAHGASTKKGDHAELEAYKNIFENNMPPLTCHKWMTGHTLGAAGCVSLALGLKQLKEASLEPLPYLCDGELPFPTKYKTPSPKTALVTSMGFGGQSTAILVSI
jgi:3-oxoacyl-[acyl-carrier-protein] synthase II